MMAVDVNERLCVWSPTDPQIVLNPSRSLKVELVVLAVVLDSSDSPTLLAVAVVHQLQRLELHHQLQLPAHMVVIIILHKFISTITAKSRLTLIICLLLQTVANLVINITSKVPALQAGPLRYPAAHQKLPMGGVGTRWGCSGCTYQRPKDSNAAVRAWSATVQHRRCQRGMKWQTDRQTLTNKQTMHELQ